MEIEGSDGSRTSIEPGSKVEWGRGLGFKSDDRTVSRRHVTFQLDPSGEHRARFRVIGKNPFWVFSSKSGKVNAFMTFETGEMEIGDMFCVSAKNPIWFTVKNADFEARIEENVEKQMDFEGELAESLRASSELKDFDALNPDSVDISQFDPIKDFGFLVIGKEFDGYSKKMIRNFRNWQWFLEEPGNENEDDEFEENKRKKGGRRKRKNSGENEDEEWTGESEEEKELLTRRTKVQTPKYLTRSKDRDKPAKDTGKGASSGLRKTAHADNEEEVEEDETLGGFIVDDDDEADGGEEIDDDEAEEEEEFVEDEDEEQLED